jgi:hypothetical protein
LPPLPGPDSEPHWQRSLAGSGPQLQGIYTFQPLRVQIPYQTRRRKVRSHRHAPLQPRTFDKLEMVPDVHMHELRLRVDGLGSGRTGQISSCNKEELALYSSESPLEILNLSNRHGSVQADRPLRGNVWKRATVKQRAPVECSWPSNSWLVASC